MRWLSKRRYKIGLLIPTLLVYSVFIVLPIVIAVGYSFTKYSGIGKARFQGFQNYIRLFQDNVFWISLKNTMIIFILAFILLLTLSFLIALLLNNRLKGTDFSKALIFSPAIIAPIIVGIIWVYILDPNIGVINNILDAVGASALKHKWIGAEAQMDRRGDIFTIQHCSHLFLAAARISGDHFYCRTENDSGRRAGGSEN